MTLEKGLSAEWSELNEQVSMKVKQNTNYSVGGSKGIKEKGKPAESSHFANLHREEVCVKAGFSEL